MKMVELLGFAPDAPPILPGACEQMWDVVPSPKGWRAAPSVDQTTIFAHHAAGGAAFHAGTFVYPPTLAYLPDASSDSLQSKAYSAGSFATAVSTASPSGLRWKLVEFYHDLSGTATSTVAIDGYSVQAMEMIGGNVVASIAAGRLFTKLYSTTAAMTEITYSPHGAQFLIESSRFMLAMACGVPGTSFTGFNDARWVCSARDDHTSWTLSPASQCTTGILPDAYGRINAVTKIGEELYVFKSQVCYRGVYVPNSAEVWEFSRAPFSLGAWRRCAVPYKQGIVFLNREGLWYYDGANLVNAMEDRLVRWWHDEVYAFQTVAYVCVDERRDIIYVGAATVQPVQGLGGPTTVLACHLPTKRWTRLTDNGEKYLMVSGPGRRQATGVNLPELSGESVRLPWVLPRTYPGITTANSHQLFTPRLLDADPLTAHAATVITNIFGEPFHDSDLRQAHVLFTDAPATATAQPIQRNNLFSAATTAAAAPIATDGHFDVHQNARWHQLRFDMQGDFELLGFMADVVARGRR